MFSRGQPVEGVFVEDLRTTDGRLRLIEGPDAIECTGRTEEEDEAYRRDLVHEICAEIRGEIISMQDDAYKVDLHDIIVY